MELTLEQWRPLSELSTTEFELDGEEFAVGPMIGPEGYGFGFADSDGGRIIAIGEGTVILAVDYAVRGALDEPAVEGERELVLRTLCRVAAKYACNDGDWLPRFTRAIAAVRRKSPEVVSALLISARAGGRTDEFVLLGAE